MIAHKMTTTQFELEGYEVKRSLGIVRGIIVRSRSVVGTIGASLQTLIGGNITLLTELCEKTRNDSFDLMLQHAAQLGANAVVGVRYDATEIMSGVTEVLCYGTAVGCRAEPLRRPAFVVAGEILRLRLGISAAGPRRAHYRTAPQVNS